ncbi:hypothetical protein KC332_g4342 [Hortaea werneckii]|uniref:Dol-P-Glc:Glc(2)Man(9)GlcNAc(2)-PP-Dol alpha-1,2-glucosyltransferase n=1 Tax=Hortaea werneckii EXF-2000 TaxID=1157616 RepID=A0A1Z5TGB3_HORWE|nr:hypothetical protein KC350_g8921 [Hortaea werneckii]OTA35053.1 hypothetical protein BTJ68_05178 [Hortaea werneckii EXF-2000]KAI6845348.1 hypothetical protein KC358_g3360 [Hortaea werneckii]KAI6920575.1 hypothetical protein KC348_g10337 [Hortaea werneckii]KAI6940747.1 hypothetical protein KC341_g3334 [Hortaea werneckii]
MFLLQSAALAPLSAWFYLVDRTVTEPYLDEVFHVRQAQLYCAGNFHDWDPKITTPPGLYLVSYLLSFSNWLNERFGFGFALPLLGCNLAALRLANVLGLALLAAVAYISYQTRSPHPRRERRLFQHSALNMVLFPPLFFFSALYYTDIWSTLSVVVFYVQMVDAHRSNMKATERFVRLVALGFVSLTFRQTNVFWITVFPAAVTLVQHLDKGQEAVRSSMHRRVDGFGDSLYSVAKTAWKFEIIYDPPVEESWIDAYAYCIVSIAACSLKTISQPQRLLGLILGLLPYLTLLAGFAGFVLWNGSVVLGDKGNHTATLHLPQLLYLWPFMTFFSLPILYPHILLVPITALAQTRYAGHLESLQIFKRRRLLPRLWLFILLLGIAGVVVWANTIVHPFTLADNRHYVFYVFRLLLRPPWMRCAVIPVYVFCAWACIQALGGGPLRSHRSPTNLLPDGEHSVTCSFVLIWLATSALQLITAPLVEPRYFILPWLFWRMHLPLRSPSRMENRRASPKTKNSTITSTQALWHDYDHRLWLETVWLLAINVVTGYIFLNWGYEWPQEPGKIQRFMW